MILLVTAKFALAYKHSVISSVSVQNKHYLYFLFMQIFFNLKLTKTYLQSLLYKLLFQKNLQKTFRFQWIDFF